jgi:simple sugar transport system ATP-binding protein
VSLRGVGKTYPGGVVAVRDVDLDLAPGEIVAICGENGAGKTTLASMAARTLEPTSGTIAGTARVGFVHQHFELIDRMRVWENVALGNEPRRGLRLDRAAARERVRALGERNGLAVDPDAFVETLPVGIAQRVEILRELGREPEVLVLDEPTAVLAPGEIDALFATLAALAARGIAIVVVTHKLGEVIAHAHRAIVMRAGTIVARFDDIAQTSAKEIARAMVGGEIAPLAAAAQTNRQPRLVVRELAAGDGAHALLDASFDVCTGEIVGIAGVEGNGQSALADALAGVVAHRGTIELDGAPVPSGPRACIAAGIRSIAQDRRREALVLPWSIADNAVLGDQHGAAFARAERRERASDIFTRFDVRAASIDTVVDTLSGGNQQKVVVGRALANDPKLVIAYQPTRGIDVGAATLVQSRLIEARNAGIAILLISFELDELFALCDRILVLFRGKIAGEVPRDAFDRSTIGTLMAGA